MLHTDLSPVTSHHPDDTESGANAWSVAAASRGDLDALAPLFDAYRQFYDQPADLKRAREYLGARLSAGEAVIFICKDAAGGAAGFTLLYPTFCSVAAAPVFVLYDLFVAPGNRRMGVATALLACAQSFALDKGAAWLKLETAIDNHPAQALYEGMGWVRDDEFYTYHFSADG